MVAALKLRFKAYGLVAETDFESIFKWHTTLPILFSVLATAAAAFLSFTFFVLRVISFLLITFIRLVPEVELLAGPLFC